MEWGISFLELRFPSPRIWASKHVHYVNNFSHPRNRIVIGVGIPTFGMWKTILKECKFSSDRNWYIPKLLFLSGKVHYTPSGFESGGLYSIKFLMFDLNHITPMWFSS